MKIHGPQMVKDKLLADMAWELRMACTSCGDQDWCVEVPKETAIKLIKRFDNLRNTGK